MDNSFLLTILITYCVILTFGVWYLWRELKISKKRGSTEWKSMSHTINIPKIKENKGVIETIIEAESVKGSVYVPSKDPEYLFSGGITDFYE